MHSVQAPRKRVLSDCIQKWIQFFRTIWILKKRIKWESIFIRTVIYLVLKRFLVRSLACQQALLSRRAKRAERERTSPSLCVLARLASLAQIGELACRLSGHKPPSIGYNPSFRSSPKTNYEFVYARSLRYIFLKNGRVWEPIVSSSIGRVSCISVLLKFLLKKLLNIFM